jgi:hypothetical protein
MLRYKYAHKKATEMYTLGKSQQEVATMLHEEGATADEAPTLANDFFRSFMLYQMDIHKASLKQGGMLKTIGLVFIICGLLLGFIMYLALDTVVVVFYGILLFGIGCFIAGFTMKSKAQNLINELDKPLHRQLI